MGLPIQCFKSGTDGSWFRPRSFGGAVPAVCMGQGLCNAVKPRRHQLNRFFRIARQFIERRKLVV